MTTTTAFGALWGGLPPTGEEGRRRLVVILRTVWCGGSKRRKVLIRLFCARGHARPRNRRRGKEERARNEDGAGRRWRQTQKKNREIQKEEKKPTKKWEEWWETSY